MFTAVNTTEGTDIFILMQDLISFMDASPSEYHVNLSHKRPRETPQAPRQPQPQLQPQCKL